MNSEQRNAVLMVAVAHVAAYTIFDEVYRRTVLPTQQFDAEARVRLSALDASGKAFREALTAGGHSALLNNLQSHGYGIDELVELARLVLAVGDPSLAKDRTPLDSLRDRNRLARLPGLQWVSRWCA